MAYMIIMLEDAGPRQVLFHPDSWNKVPGYRSLSYMPKPDEIIFDFDAHRRGLPLAPDKIPSTFRRLGNRKSLPNMFAFYDGYFGVSQIGKEFFEREAPGDCEFIPVSIVPRKKASHH
jgi:hypothetical protein